MARPQVFISSTFYDLRHIRATLEGFVGRLGYDPILSEKGKIAFDPDIALDESCYREASSADIFVLIIGGRYGSAASDESLEGKPDFYERYESITKKEYEAAVAKEIPTYILVDRSVYVEYETYRKNRDNQKVEYAHVDSVNVFRFIDSLLSKGKNNPIHQFDRHTDIEEWLLEQWAGLFRELINRRSEQRQLASLSERVDELSSINSSLQRYMEAVVSRVTATPEEATEIIREEQERQDADKRRREFEKCQAVNSALFRKENTIEKIESAFYGASHFEDLLDLYGGGADMLSYWKENETPQSLLNEARGILNLPALTFSK